MSFCTYLCTVPTYFMFVCRAIAMWYDEKLQMRSACAKFTCLYFHSICMLYSDTNLTLITAYYDFIKYFNDILT